MPRSLLPEMLVFCCLISANGVQSSGPTMQDPPPSYSKLFNQIAVSIVGVTDGSAIGRKLIVKERLLQII